jgi:probable F420-dependent oxidoreductase
LLTHVLVLPYHSPFDVAKQYATLDRLSGGRVILGVGTGHLRPEFLALGVDYDARGDVTDEYVRIIKTLWSDQPASFRGARFAFDDVHLAPRPLQQPHPPVWIGGNTRRAVRRAIELGDGWVPWQVTFDELRDRLEYARGLPSYAERAQPLDVTVPAGPIEITANAIDGARAPFAGSAEQIVGDIRAYQSIGVTGMTAGFRSRSLAERLEQLDQFARDVMPAFA